MVKKVIDARERFKARSVRPTLTIPQQEMVDRLVFELRSFLSSIGIEAFKETLMSLPTIHFTAILSPYSRCFFSGALKGATLMDKSETTSLIGIVSDARPFNANRKIGNPDRLQVLEFFSSYFNQYSPSAGKALMEGFGIFISIVSALLGDETNTDKTCKLVDYYVESAGMLKVVVWSSTISREVAISIDLNAIAKLTS